MRSSFDTNTLGTEAQFAPSDWGLPLELPVPVIEILEVTTQPGTGLHAAVDAPKPGYEGDSYVLPVAGWLHHPDSAVVRVHIEADRRRVVTAPVRFNRADVAAEHRIPVDAPVGFMTEVGILGLPLEFDLLVRAELENGYVLPFATIRGRRRPVRSSYEGALSPIFVTNVGRCGSTILMNLLRGHPGIAVQELYPYETRVVSYWIHMLKVLSDPADHVNSAHPNHYEDDPYWVGRLPHNMRPLVDPERMWSWLRRDYVENLAAFCQLSIEGFYQTVAASQHSSDVVYFAEKRNPRPTARIASELYPDAREIFLVRDPRDMVCSMISFYAKTKLVAFGRETSADDAQFVAGIGLAVRDLVQQLHEREERSLLVRYEDLVGDPPRELGRILAYLELDTSPSDRHRIVDQALADSANSQRHRTTASAASSVGRWRRDLDDTLQALCASTFSDLIPALGYTE
jgi:hypothetical protein